MIKKPDIRRAFVLSGVMIILASIVILFAHGLQLRREYRYALIDAKNIELTLRLVSFDYYKTDRIISDPLRSDGLAEGVAEEVKVLSGAQGLLTLGYWDATRQAAGSFIYKKDKYLVFYEYDINTGQDNWNIYYRIFDVGYSKWKLQS